MAGTVPGKVAFAARGAGKARVVCSSRVARYSQAAGTRAPRPTYSKPCCYEACPSPSQWHCQGEQASQREGCRAQGSVNLTEKRQGGKAGQCRAVAGPARLGRGRAGLSALGLLLPPGSQCVAGAGPRRLAAAVAFVSVPAAAAGTAAAIASHGARPRAAGRSVREDSELGYTRVSRMRQASGGPRPLVQGPADPGRQVRSLGTQDVRVREMSRGFPPWGQGPRGSAR